MSLPVTVSTRVELSLQLMPYIADEICGYTDGPHDSTLWERVDEGMWEMDLFGGAITVVLAETGGVNGLFVSFDSDAVYPVEELRRSEIFTDGGNRVTMCIDMGLWEELE